MHKAFGADVKTVSFQKVHRERREETSAGPGQYDVDRSNSMVKSKSTAAIISKTGGRPDTFASKAHIDSAAPGQYATSKEFGKDNTKSFRIGTKSIEKIEMTAGPGHYDAERSLSVTKERVRSQAFSKTMARPKTLAIENNDAAPGQYDDGKRFNSDVKSFRIGEKREEKIVKTMGPGAYDHERADSLTKSKMPNINMGGSPARPIKRTDVDVAPG